MLKNIVISVHLGAGVQGEQRKIALEKIAEKFGYFFNNKPSIGKLMVAIADHQITTAKEQTHENPNLHNE